MNIPLYCMIFFSKVLENALATLRLILVSNGKKWWGAFLQFLIALIWVFVAGIVITDIKEDPIKVIVFALGSFVGSYFGSTLEERLALGNNMITTIVNPEKAIPIIQVLKQHHYKVTILEGSGLKQDKMILMTLIPRKKRKEIIQIITDIDPNAFMSAEKVAPIVSNPESNSNNL